MTTLIAYQGNDWCLLAADTQTTGYGMATDCSPMGKIAKNGDYVIAAAGLVRGMNIMQHALVPPRAPKTKSSLAKFMVSRFIPSMRRAFISAGYDMKDDGEMAQQDNDIIIAVKGQLFFIDDVYGLEYVADRLYCGGSGMQLALGAATILGADKDVSKEDAIEILTRAVKTSIKHDIYSGGRVQMVFQDKSGKTSFEYIE